MARSTDEWIAKHDDQKVPPRVRQRIFDRENGMCHLTGRKIEAGEAWDLDHKVALILGGQHRESNLFPALVGPHRRKTTAEVAIKSKIAKVRQKHSGVIRPVGKIKSQGFPQSERAAKRQTKPSLPPKPLFMPEERT